MKHTNKDTFALNEDNFALNVKKTELVISKYQKKKLDSPIKIKL